MTHDDLIWLAGLLEGEGCFTRQVSGCPSVQVGMSDRDVIDRVAAIIGARRIYTEKRRPLRKPMFSVGIAGLAAVALMHSLAPHMGTRRGQRIAELIAAWESRPNQRQPFQAAASCHQDRRHVARGLCGACYRDWNRRLHGYPGRAHERPYRVKEKAA